jgi:hypothetical protein
MFYIGMTSTFSPGRGVVSAGKAKADAVPPRAC